MNSYMRYCLIAKISYLFVIFISCYSIPVPIDNPEASSNIKEGNHSIIKEDEPKSGVAVENNPRLIINIDGKESPSVNKPDKINEFENGEHVMMEQNIDDMKDTSIASETNQNQSMNLDATKNIDVPADVIKTPLQQNSSSVKPYESGSRDSKTDMLPKKPDTSIILEHSVLKNTTNHSLVAEKINNPPVPTSKVEQAFPLNMETSETKPNDKSEQTKAEQESVKDIAVHNDNTANSDVKDSSLNNDNVPKSDINSAYPDGVYTDTEKDLKKDTGSSETNKKTDDIHIEQLPNQVNKIQKGNSNILQDKTNEMYDDANSHFFAYFITMMVMVVLFYLLFHNKQRIIALMIEGRGARKSRRSAKAKYHKLDNNLEEAMSSTRSHGNSMGSIY